MINKITLTTGALIIKKDKLLLIKREGRLFPNKWSLSGGQINPREEIRAAIRREVKEEIGCTFEVEDFIDFSEYMGQDNNEQKHIVSLIFKGSIRGKITLDPNEVKEAKWYSYDEVLNLPLAFSYKTFFEMHRETIKKYTKDF